MSATAAPAGVPRLKLTLTATAESIVRGGHPWVYSDSIRSQNRDGGMGELAVIYDRRDRFLAVGLYDPDSPLRVRVLHAGRPATLDPAWWQSNLEAALARRSGIGDARTTGLRLINGESDGWPGLVLDRYDTTLVLKLYTAAWLPRLDGLLPMILKSLDPERVVLRLSRNIQSAAREWSGAPRRLGAAGATGPGWSDGEMLYGPALQGPVTFRETGIRFESDVLHGQKTGFFLDQRENRRRVESLATGARVLNAFSFSGGFSLYSARGGARSVTDLDISSHALTAARRNFQLNQEEPRVSSCEHHAIQADAFKWLDQAGDGQFDLVIVDPPSLARRESERAGAIQAYRRLNANSIRLLGPSGILVAASCSAHVGADEFFGAVRSVARSAGRRHEELGTTGHAPDHRATFPEAQYLKCIYLRFD